MLEELKERLIRVHTVLSENKNGWILPGLSAVSAIDRDRGLIAVTPAGPRWEPLNADDIVVVDLVDGRVAEGKNKPSPDVAAHLHLYRTFPSIGGIVRCATPAVTAWAQAGKSLPAYGTAHASAFSGAVPCSRALTDAETGRGAELNVGKIVAETVGDADPLCVPAVLVKSHCAYAWGESPEKAAENALVLEFAADTALKTLLVQPETEPLEQKVTDRFRARKRSKKTGK